MTIRKKGTHYDHRINYRSTAARVSCVHAREAGKVLAYQAEITSFKKMLSLKLKGKLK
jgi:hypothetical protein